MIQCKIGADEKRGAQILKEMEEALEGFSSISIPLVVLVVEGMRGNKPIILAEKRYGDKQSDKKT